jgi:hypothetical protein
VELGGREEELELGAPEVGGDDGEHGRGVPVDVRANAGCAWRCPEVEPPTEHVILVDPASSPSLASFHLRGWWCYYRCRSDAVLPEAKASTAGTKTSASWWAST